MGMFDTLHVLGSDRDRFRAPWGAVYDNFQSKDLCDLIESEPVMRSFTLEDGMLRYFHNGWLDRMAKRSDSERGHVVEASGTAHVYDFADNSDINERSLGWVEWKIHVHRGHVVAVEAVEMRRGKEKVSDLPPAEE